MTILLDTHVVQWSSAEPHRLSPAARSAIDDADEVAVSAVTWYELAWLAEHDRITISVPVRTWLDRLARDLRTIGLTPSIAATAAALPPTFPRDPADRVIYATGVEHGLRIVTKDRQMRRHRYPTPITIW